jgi:hypothetical protein
MLCNKIKNFYHSKRRFGFDLRSVHIIQRMRKARWIPKAANTHSEYVILIAFSPATMVTRTGLKVTLRIRKLPVLFVEIALIMKLSVHDCLMDISITGSQVT